MSGQSAAWKRTSETVFGSHKLLGLYRLTSNTDILMRSQTMTETTTCPKQQNCCGPRVHKHRLPQAQSLNCNHQQPITGGGSALWR